MTIEELKKKAEESFNNKLQKDVCYCTYNEEKIYKDGYIAGAKEMQKENEEFKKLFIFQKGKCVGKSKISVRPTAHYYGKDWNGYEYYKYSCPICDNSDCNHQVAKGELNCPICGINLEWEVT